MPYLYDSPNLSGGIDTAIVDVAGGVPTFIPMFLLFVWGVVFFGGIMAQKKRMGYSDVPLWATIAGMATIMVSLPMTLVVGIIGLDTLIIVTVITIFCGLWLFFDRHRNEI